MCYIRPFAKLPNPYRYAVRILGMLPLAFLPLGAQAATGDSYEPDDTQAQAAVIWSVDPSTLPPGLPDALKDLGIPQTHTIHDAQDQDWLTFQAAGNDWYEVHVWPQDPTLDLRIDLYDEQGLSLGTADWNFAGASEILSYHLQGPSQQLWARITALDYQDTGRPQGYQVAVLQPYLEFDGFIDGTVSNSTTGAALAGARVTSSRGSGVLTLPNGAYLMPHVAGQFAFTATAPGSSGSVTQTAEIQALSYTEQNFRLSLNTPPPTTNPGTISFTSAQVFTTEASGAVSIQVERRGGTDGLARVSVRTEDGTAKAGQDFTSTSSPLEWAAGAGGARTVSIPVLNDTRHEETETFRVVLERPEGAKLEGWSVTTVSIADDDASVISSAPIATTSTASRITATSAQINGRVDDRGAATGVEFDYGLTTGYGATLAAQPSTLSADAGSTAVTASLSGLTCGTPYHYRVRASNSAGSATGNDQVFTTASCSGTDHVLTVTLRGSDQGRVTSDPAGIDCGSDCDQTYPVNTLVTLTPIPTNGATFGAWGGACSGTGTCRLTMDADRSVTANFTDGGGVLKDPQDFVAQQYRDFLGREGESDGISYWVDQVTAGRLTRAQVVDGFFNSSEFQGAMAPLARLYFAYFNRIPDYGGLMYWINQVQAGDSLTMVSQGFANSAEFNLIYGALDDAAFVDRVYQNVLGRAPDASERTHWIAQLAGGTGRGELMIDFSESPEYRSKSYNRVQVTMMYIGMLRRAPEQNGFDYWINDLMGGHSVLELINGFLVSDEYAGRFTS